MMDYNEAVRLADAALGELLDRFPHQFISTSPFVCHYDANAANAVYAYFHQFMSTRPAVLHALRQQQPAALPQVLSDYLRCFSQEWEWWGDDPFRDGVYFKRRMP